jgi:hypothetical protein
MSLFLAFATLWPDYELRIFLILPVRVKWLALLDAAVIAGSVGFGSGWHRLVPLAAVGNYLLFFGPTLYDKLRGFVREGGRARARFRQAAATGPRRCAICGVSADDPDVDIRVCSCETCGGKNRDLCLAHARNH